MDTSFFGQITRVTLAEQGSPYYTGTALHTSTQAIPIPIVWGTRRVTPNVIWRSAVPDTTSAVPNNVIPAIGPDVSGVGLGITYGYWLGQVQIASGHIAGRVYSSNDTNSSDSSWWVPMMLALCEGPVNSIPRMWNGGGTLPLSGWTTPFGYVSTQPNGTYSEFITPPSLFYTPFLGDGAQTAWAFFSNAYTLAHTSAYTGMDLAYRFTCYLASTLMNCGHGNVPPQQSFEVVRTPTGNFQADSYSIGFDYNLASAVPDLLTSTRYGMGLASSDIDSTTLANFLAYQLAQGLFFSPLLDSQNAGVDIIDRWATISNTWIYWSGTAIMFAPLGDETIGGFTPDTTPAYNLGLTDFLEPGLTVDRADPIDCFNRVRLEFCDRANDYSKTPIEWKDTTLINQFGLRDASSIDGQDICDIVVAAKCVELIGKRIAYVRNLYTFSLSYRYIRILPGTIVTLTDPNLGLNLQPVRVRTVEEADNGALKIVAEEYPGTLGLSRPLSAQTWSPSSGPTGGSASPGTGGGLTPTTPTSGGVLVMTGTESVVLFVAGDVVTLPATPSPGKPYVFVHDQKRSPQPTPASLEANPATFNVPGGAAYTVVDLYDRTTSGTSLVVDKRSGLTFTLVNTSDTFMRPVD